MGFGTLIDESMMDLHADIIEQMRQDLYKKRQVQIVKELSEEQKIDCPNCGRDLVTGKSNYEYEPTTPYPSGIPGPIAFSAGSVCPICRGNGEIMLPTESVEIVTALAFIRYYSLEDTAIQKNDDKTLATAGILENMDLKLKFNIKYRSDIELANYFIVDGDKYYRMTNPKVHGLGKLSQVVVYCSNNHKFTDVRK